MTLNQLNQLRETLTSLMSAIARKENIADHLTEIGRIQTDIATTAKPQLIHFLQNRSYEKALEYLSHGSVIEDPNRPDCDEEELHP